MLNLPRTIELQPCSHVSLTCCWRNTNFACSIYSCGFLAVTHFKVVFFIKNTDSWCECVTSWSSLLLTIKMMNDANYYGTSQHRRCDGTHLHPDWFCLTLPSLLWGNVLFYANFPRCAIRNCQFPNEKPVYLCDMFWNFTLDIVIALSQQRLNHLTLCN